MIRNIQDIAPLLADHFVDVESAETTLEDNNKLVTDNAQRLGKEIFSNAYDNYYKYFKTQLDTGLYLSNQSNCYELYYEYEKQLNG